MRLSPIRSELLDGVPHGFFTREGGVSGGIYASLNGGQGSADQPEAVAANRARIETHFGGRPLVTVHQIHSATAVVVTDPDAPRPQADAMVARGGGAVLGVLTADCTPVLFADREAGVIGAAHAGWKGAHAGILEATLDAMEGLGADRAKIVAAIGPVISQRAYEVGPEFVERFVDDDPDTARYFADGQGDRALFDLPGYCMGRLRAAGAADAAWTGHCTYSDPQRFYSYRRSCHRDEADYGRLVAAITL